MSRSQHPAAGYPGWLPRPSCPLVVVIGPPGNGAAAHVAFFAAPGDAIIDLAMIIAELSGMPAPKAGQEWLIPALRERNERLAALATHPPAGTAWLITGAPKGWQRQFWRDMTGAQIVLLDPGRTAAVLAARDAGVSERFVHQWYAEAANDSAPGADYTPPQAPPGPRPSAEKRGYGREHRVLRDEQLAREPWCRMCQDERGLKVVATVLDHIRPFKRLDGTMDYKLWGDRKNHRSLCAVCHAAHGKQRNRGETAPGVGADGRPLDPAHPWNRK